MNALLMSGMLNVKEIVEQACDENIEEFGILSSDGASATCGGAGLLREKLHPGAHQRSDIAKVAAHGRECFDAVRLATDYHGG